MSDRGRRVFVGAAFIALLAVFTGCATVRPVLVAPAGFAEYRDEESYRAVSPEGVVLRVRLVDNEPTQSLEFWAEALGTQLQSSGYSRLRREALETRAGKAVLLEWAAPVGQEDWVYLTGLTLSGNRIAIVEAAGAYAHYQKHRAAILDSLRSLEVR
jgi:hypothetical protein